MGIDDAHDLLPDELAKLIPPLYATEDEDDSVAHVKLFTPDSSWTWHIVEHAPDERLCFGPVVGLERELGYFSLKELEEIRGPWGLRVERDLYWKPRPVSECC